MSCPYAPSLNDALLAGPGDGHLSRHLRSFHATVRGVKSPLGTSCHDEWQPLAIRLFDARLEWCESFLNFVFGARLLMDGPPDDMLGVSRSSAFLFAAVQWGCWVSTQASTAARTDHFRLPSSPVWAPAGRVIELFILPPLILL